MTDLEMTRLAAEAMGYEWSGKQWGEAVYLPRGPYMFWDPLHDDAQAMALVKKFRIAISVVRMGGWLTSCPDSRDWNEHSDLNRAIVECVANMQKARTKSAHPSPEKTDSV